MIDKKESINYWNAVAKDWKQMVYNTDKPAKIFPSSQLREKIVIKDIKKRIKKDAKILDIGCADGSLIIQLIKEGYTNVKGIDNSPSMIEEANRQLEIITNSKNTKTNNVFEIADADAVFTKEKFDVIIVLGLIEYVEDLNRFFNYVYSILNKGGITYIESKNKLFNLFSANKYMNEFEIKTLIEELDEVEHLSPNKAKDIVFDTYIETGRTLEEKTIEKKEVTYKKYPFNLLQYSPKELMKYTERNLFKTEKIVYYHFHPFPPRYKKDISELYDMLGTIMQPLGYTSIGMLMCSSYVMVIKK